MQGESLCEEGSLHPCLWEGGMCMNGFADSTRREVIRNGYAHLGN